MGATFLCYLKRSLFFTGILPYKMVTTNVTCYTLFRNISHTIYFVLLMFMYLEIPYIWNNSDQIIGNVNMIPTFTVLALKICICRSQSIADLICEMVAMEENIKASGDRQILSIYDKYTKRGRYIQLYNIIVNITVVGSYVTPYVFKYLITYHFKEHGDEDERKLPYHMWLPFNKNDHYVTAFAINLYLMTTSIVYYFSAPVLIIILLLYTSFRLKLLGYLLRNIKIFVNKVTENEEDDAVEAVIRFCILEHIKIIK